ncbi:MAG: aldo/keto reductase [Sebaldella sp.]|nr:aldo/keto reductase [Sebaldella sp.]
MKYKGFGLGCMHLSTKNQSESSAVIHAALDKGVSFLNTGDFYGSGESEMAVGEALKGYNRDKFYMSVKFGVLSSPNGKIYGLDVHPDRIKNYLVHSLKRLKLDYIDLYEPARIDLSIPVEETIGAIAELVKEGYVRHIGLTQIDAATLERANAVHKIEYVEMDYSLFNRSIEEDIIPLARKLDIGVVSFGTIAHGLLTGLWTKERLERGELPTNMMSPLFSKENIGKNVELVERLHKIAEEKNVSVSQLAHAWVLSKGDDIIPLIGASKLKHFEDSIMAGNISLSKEDIQKIEAAIPEEEIAGTSFRKMQFKDGFAVQG